MKETFLPLIVLYIFFPIAILSQEFGTLISRISLFSPSGSEIHFQKKFPEEISLKHHMRCAWK